MSFNVRLLISSKHREPNEKPMMAPPTPINSTFASKTMEINGDNREIDGDKGR